MPGPAGICLSFVCTLYLRQHLPHTPHTIAALRTNTAGHGCAHVLHDTGAGPRPRPQAQARRGVRQKKTLKNLEPRAKNAQLTTRLYITFVDKDGSEHKFAVAAGDNLLDIAQANDLEMEGACGGSCACSTCHIIVDEASYDQMPEPDDDENDMLDLAFGLTETSRLGCQVTMTKELDGLVVRLPTMTRNLQASDFESKAAA